MSKQTQDSLRKADPTRLVGDPSQASEVHRIGDPRPASKQMVGSMVEHDLQG